MKQLNHKSLAAVSGIILILIIGVNIVFAPEGGEGIPNTTTSTVDEAQNNEEEVLNTQDRVQNPNAIIDLSGDRLTKVPDIIFKRTNIEILDISNNNLKGALQAEVRHMSSLRVLDMSENMFTGVPAEVGQLENLEVLDLSNNRITGLPYEIGNLKNLKTLDIRGNKYSEQDLEIIRSNLPDTTEIITN